MIQFNVAIARLPRGTNLACPIRRRLRAGRACRNRKQAQDAEQGIAECEGVHPVCRVHSAEQEGIRAAQRLYECFRVVELARGGVVKRRGNGRIQINLQLVPAGGRSLPLPGLAQLHIHEFLGGAV